MDCAKCKAMKTATKSKMDLQTVAAIYKLAIICVSIVLLAAICTGAFLFDRHFGRLEALLSGAEIDQTVVDSGDCGIAVCGDNNEIKDNEVTHYGESCQNED